MSNNFFNFIFINFFKFVLIFFIPDHFSIF